MFILMKYTWSWKGISHRRIPTDAPVEPKPVQQHVITQNFRLRAGAVIVVFQRWNPAFSFILYFLLLLLVKDSSFLAVQPYRLNSPRFDLPASDPSEPDKSEQDSSDDEYLAWLSVKRQKWTLPWLVESRIQLEGADLGSWGVLLFTQPWRC